MDLLLEQGKNVRNPPPEDEGVKNIMCDELTLYPTPPPLLVLGREKVENQE